LIGMLVLPFLSLVLQSHGADVSKRFGDATGNLTVLCAERFIAGALRRSPFRFSYPKEK
jgi:hypothetical protein